MPATKNQEQGTMNRSTALAPLSLPTTPETAIQGDPAFADLRRHYTAFKAGVTVALGAAVAMGAEIARLRAEVQPTEGRPKKTGNIVASFSGTPWREIVQAQSQVNHETARRAEKVAADLRSRLDGKRDKLSSRARRLLDHPGEIATFDDYEVLAQVCGHHYDADTWHGILVEAGIVRRPVSQIAAESGRGTPGEQLELPLFEQACIFARGYLATMRDNVRHREKYLARLAALPLSPTGDPHTPSLAELRAEINDRLAEIDQVIARKQSAA